MRAGHTDTPELTLLPPSPPRASALVGSVGEGLDWQMQLRAREKSVGGIGSRRCAPQCRLLDGPGPGTMTASGGILTECTQVTKNSIRYQQTLILGVDSRRQVLVRKMTKMDGKCRMVATYRLPIN